MKQSNKSSLVRSESVEGNTSFCILFWRRLTFIRLNNLPVFCSGNPKIERILKYIRVSLKSFLSSEPLIIIVAYVEMIISKLI